jgi:simple sugar transport system ATP-binding protein
MSSADIDKAGQAQLDATRGPASAATPRPGGDGEERNGGGSTATPLVELRGIWKYYGSTPAVRDVNLTVNPGEVVGLVGDNGSGKSTLVKIIMGYHRPTRGVVRLFGNDVSMHSPAQARTLGIEAVYQDLALIDELSLWRNFFLGRELRSPLFEGNRLDRKRMRVVCRSKLEELGLVHIRTADEPASVLSGGEKQSLAITRAVHFGARLLILDEPTAALSVRETRSVLSVISSARDRGLGVIYIDHNMEHVTPVADRIAFLEHGNIIETFRLGETSTEELREMIAGVTLGELRNRWDEEWSRRHAAGQDTSRQPK